MRSDRAAANIEAVYPLTPIQEGMLFHCLEATAGGLYVEQYMCLVKGLLQPEHFRAAWDETVASHTTLRAFFVWDKTERPVQVVRREASVPWRFLDWTDVDNDERAVRFETLLSSDRAQGFILDQAPLMRITLIKQGADLHRMLWTSHHLLMDGWSTPQVLREVLQRYRAKAAGQSLELPPPPPLAPYLEWVLHQDLSAAEPFWRHTLSSFRHPNELLPPASHASEAGSATSSHGQAWLKLSADTTSTLARFAQEHRLTTSTLFYAAWAVVVGLYSQRQDVIFGMTVSGRSAGPEGIERVIGLFLNTIPLRIALDPQQNVLDWLRRVQTHQLAAMEFEQTPLAAIQAWSDVPAGEALFESLAVFENYPDSGETLDADSDIRVDGIEFREHTNYPVSAIAAPGPELRLLIVHDRTRLDGSAAERLVKQLGAILTRLPAHADDSLSVLDPLPAEERNRLLELSFSPSPCPLNSTDILDRIVTSADRHPRNAAVVCASERLDYGQLLNSASILAGRLRAQGIGPNSYVGVCVDRGVGLPTAVLGVLISGAAYVPLDPGYPRDRLAVVLSELSQANAGPAPLITQRALLDLDLAPDGATLCIDDPAGESPPPSAAVAFAPEHPAYAIFTSGSTGKPKGVVVSRANLGASTEARHSYYAGRAPQCFLLTSTFAFDSAAAGLYWTLTSGGRLVLLPPGAAPDMALLANLIEQEGVTHTLMLPSLYRLLLENTDPERLRSLTVVIVAGEACPAAVVTLHKNRLPGAELHNEYGPTEATVWCTAERLDAHPNDTLPAIGKPIPGARVSVVDESRQLLPIGIPGEIAVSGAGVAVGYLNAAGQSTQRFVQDPFVAGARMYLTGDHGYVGADGRIRFLGRMDEQIKVRGHRVEPTEIESLLRAHPDIAEAAVVLVDGLGLVGFVIPTECEALATAALTQWLADRLPGFMVPRRWQTITTLPTTVTGKLDRRALALQAERDRTQRVEPGIEAKPRSDDERILGDILAHVLNLEQIGIEDNFFELGGDSIKSIQVAAEARRQGLSISAHDLFTHQTTAALAAVAESVQAGATASPGRPREAPLSPIQVWFHELQLSAPNHWNQSFIVDLSASLDKQDVESALHELVARHDALHVQFRMPGLDRSGRQLLREVKPKVLEFNFSSFPADLAASAEDEAIQGLQRQLNPSRGVVLAAAAFDLGSPQAARLLLTAHHLCVDVLSWPLLLSDLDKLLASSSVAESRPTPGSYLAYAKALTQEAASQQTLAELDYWLQQVTPTDSSLPVDTKEGADDEASGRSLVTVVSAEQAPVLRNHAGSVALPLLSALALTLAKWREQQSVTILMEGHGREPVADARDVDTTVGWFTSLFPLRIDLPDIDAEPEQALACAQQAWRGVPRGGLGYGLLRYLTPDPAVRAQLAGCALPPVLFNYLGWVGQDARIGPTLGSARHCPNSERDAGNQRPHLLEVTAWSETGGIRINWRYSGNRHFQATIAELAQEMQASLTALNERAIDKVADAPPDMGEDLGLDEHDLDQLLTQLSD